MSPEAQAFLTGVACLFGLWCLAKLAERILRR